MALERNGFLREYHLTPTPLLKERGWGERGCYSLRKGACPERDATP